MSINLVWNIFTGAHWDTQSGAVADALLKELTPAMPVMSANAISVAPQETKKKCIWLPYVHADMYGPTHV